jgi:hypothetical protein
VVAEYDRRAGNNQPVPMTATRLAEISFAEPGRIIRDQNGNRTFTGTGVAEKGTPLTSSPTPPTGFADVNGHGRRVTEALSRDVPDRLKALDEVQEGSR